MPDYSLLTVPTPAVYDDKEPTQQQENLSYVRLQEYALLKAQAATDATTIAALWTAQTSAISTRTALLTAWRSKLADATEQAEVSAMIAQNAELLGLSQGPENYTFRQARLHEQMQTLETLFLKAIWQDYQYNAQEYDLDWLKVLLVGKNLFLTP